MPRHPSDQTLQSDLSSLGLETGTPVSAAIEIAAPPQAVWQGIAEAGYLKRCHPFCDSTNVERWPGVGSRDSITYYSGRKYHRNFVEWFDGVGYDIELGDRPHVTARVRWRIAPLSERSCQFSIEVIPYLRAHLSHEQKLSYQDRLFGSDLQHYLECVVKGVEFWIRTGQDVAKDQFGRNPLYSG